MYTWNLIILNVTMALVESDHSFTMSSTLYHNGQMDTFWENRNIFSPLAHWQQAMRVRMGRNRLRINPRKKTEWLRLFGPSGPDCPSVWKRSTLLDLCTCPRNAGCSCGWSYMSCTERQLHSFLDLEAHGHILYTELPLWNCSRSGMQWHKKWWICHNVPM